jgi:hypothetical protein
MVSNEYGIVYATIDIERFLFVRREVPGWQLSTVTEVEKDMFVINPVKLN